MRKVIRRAAAEKQLGHHKVAGVMLWDFAKTKPHFIPNVLEIYGPARTDIQHPSYGSSHSTRVQHDQRGTRLDATPHVFKPCKTLYPSFLTCAPTCTCR